MLEGAMEAESIPGRNRGMKRWGREDRVARPWSIRRGAGGKVSSHDKGIRGTKRYRRPFLEDNGGIAGRRVTIVTPFIDNDATRWWQFGMYRCPRPILELRSTSAADEPGDQVFYQPCSVHSSAQWGRKDWTI